ncbi:hypothetical protein F4556_007585, partial [Kitasatospora gansuensis]
SWSPLPGDQGEAVYQSYLRVLDVLGSGMADVVYGRADLVPGVPMLIGADGRTELVQLLDVEVEGEDLVRLAWLRDELTQADGDLAALLDDVAGDRHAPWWTGEGTDGATVAAWASRAINAVVNREVDGRAELLAIVRAGAGQERIQLTAEREEAYGRYMVAVIKASRGTGTDAALTAFSVGL